MPHEDPTALSAEELVELFPDMGLLCAEDVVEWRDANGAFPDARTLVATLGIDPDLADRIVAQLTGSGRTATVAVAPSPTSAPERHAAGAAATDPSAPPEPDALLVEPGLARPTVVFRSSPSEGQPAVAVSEPALPVASGARAERAECDAGNGTAPAPRADADADAPSVAPSSRTRPRRAPANAALFGLLIAANVGLAAGLLHTRREEKRAVAPIGVQVDALRAAHEDVRARLDETHAQVQETRARVDAHEAAIARATAAANDAAARQRAAEQAAAERAARDARERAALTERVTRVERRTKDLSYSLEEALDLIDAVQGKKAPVAASAGAPAHDPKRR